MALTPLAFHSSSSPNCFLDVLLIVPVVTFSCSVYGCHGSCNELNRDSLTLFNLSISTTRYALNWSLSVDCCSWEGIGCDANERVTRLWLPSTGLVGSISPSIGNLTYLSQLNLSQNSLSGSIPDGFFSSLNSLVIVDLSHNRLTGELSGNQKLPSSAEMVDLSSNNFYGTVHSSFLQQALNLQRLNVSNNRFSGSIPSSICRFSPSIRHLDLSANDFMGSIARGFGMCPKLRSLRAGSNNLSGAIPSDIYKISSLEELDLSQNKLSGGINGSIVNLISLRVLALYRNKLTGNIPQDIGRLSNLEQLLLHANQLNGTLPWSLTNCMGLVILNLRDNFLEGELSGFNFSKFNQLTTIDLFNNSFKGRLPVTLFSCKNLTAIRLSTNHLKGEILPETIALQSLSFLSVSLSSLTNITRAIQILSQCKNLRTLILNGNFQNEQLPEDESLIGANSFKNLHLLGLGSCGLTGQIPMWLSRLNKLEVLDLSNNKITGFIPRWLGDLPNLFYLDMSQNLLSGKLPIELARLRRLKYTADKEDSTYNLELPLFITNNSRRIWHYNDILNMPLAIRFTSNNLTGTIPSEIGQLKLMTFLDLRDNNLSGRIPDSLSNLTCLETVDLSSNHLCCEIPASFKSLHFLSFFSVSHNNLQGPIPEGGQFDTFPSAYFEGNPQLCG